MQVNWLKLKSQRKWATDKLNWCKNYCYIVSIVTNVLLILRWLWTLSNLGKTCTFSIYSSCMSNQPCNLRLKTVYNISFMFSKCCHDIRYNDIQHNDTQHKGFICGTQHKWHLSIATLCLYAECWVWLCWVSRFAYFYVEWNFAESPYAECHYAECH